MQKSLTVEKLRSRLVCL